MSIWDKFRIPRSDLKNYQDCYEIISELKKVPKVQELLFKRRENYLKKVFSLEGEAKLKMEGRIQEINDLLNLQTSMANHVLAFRQAAKEREVDIEEQLEVYEQELQ